MVAPTAVRDIGVNVQRRPQEVGNAICIVHNAQCCAHDTRYNTRQFAAAYFDACKYSSRRFPPVGLSAAII